MPIEQKYDHNKKILFVTVIGQITPDEFASAFQKIVSSNQYPPNVDALWDMQQADFKEINEGMFREIIKIRKQYPERSNYSLAIIATDDLAYGMARMYGLLSGLQLSRKYMVFKDPSEGEQWILQNRTVRLRQSPKKEAKDGG